MGTWKIEYVKEGAKQLEKKYTTKCRFVHDNCRMTPEYMIFGKKVWDFLSTENGDQPQYAFLADGTSMEVRMA